MQTLPETMAKDEVCEAALVAVNTHFAGGIFLGINITLAILLVFVGMFLNRKRKKS